MASYRLKLEVVVTCPEDPKDPALTITPNEIRESLRKTMHGGGYAVGGSHGRKLTASMNVLSIEFEDFVCGHCGHRVPVEFKEK